MKKIFLLIIPIILLCVFCTACSKDDILGIYDKFLKTTGDMQLTSKFKLKGKREFGEDHYVGTYKVEYSKYSGEEVIFGGTTIEREQSNIHIKIELSDCDGSIKVIMKQKENDEILATENGTYEYDFDVKDGSNYLIIQAKKFSGKLNIEVK